MSKRNNYLLFEVLENIEQKSLKTTAAATGIGFAMGIAAVVAVSKVIIITWLRTRTHFSNTPL